VASIIETDTSDAWMAKFSQANVAVEMVSYPNELADDPQIRYRGMIYEEEVSDVGTVRQVGLSIRLSETPGTIRSLGPATGEQTEEILEELGYSSPEVKALRASDSVT
jgi:formyl-CoA transferase